MTATAEPSGAWAHKERKSDLAPKYACGVAAPQALRSGRAKRKSLADYANARPRLGSEVPGESTVPSWDV